MVCPLCRKEDYDKKDYYEGQKRFIIESCINMQKLSRGHITRCKFYDDLVGGDRHFKEVIQTVSMRRKIIAHKMHRMNQKQIGEMNQFRQEHADHSGRMATELRDAEAIIQ